MKNLAQNLKAFTDKFDATARKVAAGSFLMAVGPMASAQDAFAIDTSDVLVKIGVGVAAALVVSVAMTGAVLGIKASKLPRRAG